MKIYDVDELQKNPTLCGAVTEFLGAGNKVTVVDVMKSSATIGAKMKLFEEEKMLPDEFQKDFKVWAGSPDSPTIYEALRALRKARFPDEVENYPEKRDIFLLEVDAKLEELIVKYQDSL